MHDHPALNALFHTPMIALAFIDGDGRIARVNRAFARFTRYLAQEIEGRPLSCLLPATPLPEYGERVRLRFLAKDGQELWGDACLLPLAAPGEHGDGCILQVLDCTGIEREQQLYKGRARVLELLYSNQSLTAICEAIVHYVEAISKEVRASILLFDPDRGTLHKAAAPNLPDFYNEAIEGMQVGDGVGSCGTAVFRRERVIVADILNHPYWQQARRLVARTPMRACWSEPIIAADGGALGSFALYYDSVREPQPDELELIASAASLTAIAISYKRNEEVLRDLDRAKDEYISTAAHELRTPLTAVIGYADLLASSSHTPERQQEYAAEIFRNGETLEELIDDLLDVSVIQIGRKLSIKKETIEFLPLVERTLNSYRHHAPGHQVELLCLCVPPLNVRCDPRRITQVLENLISNAVKYSPPGSTVRIKIEKVDRDLHISVRDEGIGMSRKEVARAFDKFYRADHSSHSPRGLGLGLSIVRQIIEGHDGRIELQSQPRQGTCALFTLPLS